MTRNIIKKPAEISQVFKEENVKQPVIYLSTINEGKKSNVILLGENHLATKGEERAAGRILPYFKYFGCEGVNIEGFVEGRIFSWVMDHIMSPLVSISSFRERRSKKNKSFIDKTYEYAYDEVEIFLDRQSDHIDNHEKQKKNSDKTYDYDNILKKKIFMLENGWKPGIRMRAFFIAIPTLFIISLLSITTSTININSEYGNGWALIYIICLIFFVMFSDKIPLLKNMIGVMVCFMFDYLFDIGPSRNRNMAKNLVTILNTNKDIDEIIVLTGSSHTFPIAKILKNKYGFVEN